MESHDHVSRTVFRGLPPNDLLALFQQTEGDHHGDTHLGVCSDFSVSSRHFPVHPRPLGRLGMSQSTVMEQSRRCSHRSRSLSLGIRYPVCVMGYVYFKILRKLQQKKHSLRSKKPLDNPPSSTGMTGNLAKRQNREARKVVHPSRNITMTLCILFGVYVVCWTPNQFTFLQFNFGGPLDFTGIWYQITVTMAFINSCVNPFIYAFRLDKFKKGMRMLLACKWEQEGKDMKMKSTFTESKSFNKLDSTN